MPPVLSARLLHPVERANGAGELAFERPQMVHVLDEARGAKRVGAVEDLVAHSAALRQAAFCQPHAQPRHAVAGHHDDRAVIAQLEGDSLPFQVLDDRARVLVRELGEQHGHLRRCHARDQEREERDHRDGDRRHGRDPRRPQRFQELKNPLHRRSQPRSCPNPARIAWLMVTVGLTSR
jgi:hypothetical protein